jgi:hypothetical protein
MKKNTINTQDSKSEISRKEAIKKIGKYGKYAALTSLGTFILLHPLKSQAGSAPEAPDGF